MKPPKGNYIKEQCYDAGIRLYNREITDRVSARLGYRVKVWVLPVGYESRRKRKSYRPRNLIGPLGALE